MTESPHRRDELGSGGDARGSSIPIVRSLDTRRAEELALVLTARGVPHLVAPDGNAFALVVAPRYAAHARRELSRYLRENEGWPPRDEPEPLLTRGLPAAFAAAIVLLVAWRVQVTRWLRIDWQSIGRVDGGEIRAGAIERLATALTLHADAIHVLSNVVFGIPLFAGLCQSLGYGAGMLLALLSGIAGNGASVLLREPEYASIGASTAVFGALGCLLGYRFFADRLRRRTRFARWTPVVIGILYFGWLGTGGERTDVLAHLTGLGCGFLLGGLASLVPRRYFASLGVQRACAVATVLLLVSAWVLAVARSER